MPLLSDNLIGLASKKQKMDTDSVMLQVKGRMQKWNFLQRNRGNHHCTQNHVRFSHDMDASKLASGLESQEGSNDTTGFKNRQLKNLGYRLRKNLYCQKRNHLTSTVSKVDSQREEKLEIDLMLWLANRLLLPWCLLQNVMALLILSSNPKPAAQDAEMSVKKEGVLFEDKVTKTVREKGGLKLDLRSRIAMCSRNCNLKLLGGQAGNSKLQLGVQRNDFKIQSGSLPLPIAIPRWQSSNLLPLGYTTSFQTVVPMDGTTRSSKALQPAAGSADSMWSPIPRNLNGNALLRKTDDYQDIHRKVAFQLTKWQAVPNNPDIYFQNDTQKKQQPNPPASPSWYFNGYALAPSWPSGKSFIFIPANTASSDPLKAMQQ
ncbi:hypothetical protein NC652_014582 [Populus alba x Populus x berolinensis]|nr:hypothetical protein NC652_014582 [Populus alba x Populus x berolinensis]